MVPVSDVYLSDLFVKRKKKKQKRLELILAELEISQFWREKKNPLQLQNIYI